MNLLAMDWKNPQHRPIMEVASILEFGTPKADVAGRLTSGYEKGAVVQSFRA